MSGHLSLRVGVDRKKKIADLGRRLGYPDTSKFMNALIDALSERYDGEEWETGLVHLDEDTVVEQPDRSVAPAEIYSFPIVAPARFWRYLRRNKVDPEP